jgi:hypothetical protein
MEKDKKVLHVNFPNNLLFLPDQKERLCFSRAADAIILGSLTSLRQRCQSGEAISMQRRCRQLTS